MRFPNLSFRQWVFSISLVLGVVLVSCGPEETADSGQSALTYDGGNDSGHPFEDGGL